MTAQEIFKAAGYATRDNRSIYWRNINKAMEFGINVELVPLGQIKTNKRGFDYRLYLYFVENQTRHQRYSLADHLRKYHDCPDITGRHLIEKILIFRKDLINDGVIKNFSELSQEEVMPKCQKCGGKGIIRAFMHVCQGVCFDCMGLGYGNQGKLKHFN